MPPPRIPPPRVGRVTAESPNRKWPPFQFHPDYLHKDTETLCFVAILLPGLETHVNAYDFSFSIEV